jgi:hypothetical protein
MNTHEIHPSELDKQWEPYYLYMQKLSNILTKGGVRIGTNIFHFSFISFFLTSHNIWFLYNYLDNSTSDSSKKRSANNTKNRQLLERDAKDDDHIDSNSENQENYEGVATSTRGRSNNFATSSFGDEDTNNSLVNSNERLTGNKRSAPIDDDVENLRSPKKRKPTNRKRQRGKEEEEASNGEGNEESDSDESFQSLADIRTKRKVRR